MLFEIKNAKLVEVADVTSGTSKSGNDWTKATAIVEKVEGNYTDTYPLLVFGDKIQEAQALVGTAVDVKFNVQAREYNGRWYIDLGLRFISAAATERPAPKQTPAPNPAPAPNEKDDPDADLPF
ncbi:MAG: DUF3127 domain-containing protein [Clostridia bacterium]|nr:DUF3127 domain-containing protein [Clostridia bacterium]